MKSIFVLILSVVAVTARNICMPGSVFMSDCNVCICSKNGKTAACSDMICPEVVSNKMDTSSNEQICEASKKFKMDDCTTCLCNEDGTKAQCTLQMCMDKANMFSIANHKYCTPGRVFKRDECTTCTCNAFGTAAQCTLNQCSSSPLEGISSTEQICRPMSVFKDYCNTCFCGTDGKSFSCTKMICDREVWNKNGTVKVVSKEIIANFKKDTDVCTPGKIIRNYCNTCSCNDEGSAFSCTRMFCDLEMWNKNGTLKEDIKVERLEKLGNGQVCTPNSRFMENCNTCTCSSNGMLKSCTLRKCDGIPLKITRNINIESEEENLSPEQVCKPGKSYKPDKCNTCVCNEYGTVINCTAKVCMTTLKRAAKADELEEWGPEYKQGDACTPGKIFLSSCNTCICTENGISAHCTFMNCEKNI